MHRIYVIKVTVLVMGKHYLCFGKKARDEQDIKPGNTIWRHLLRKKHIFHPPRCAISSRLLALLSGSTISSLQIISKNFTPDF